MNMPAEEVARLAKQIDAFDDKFRWRLVGVQN
jgi:hypothetical protein